MPPKKNESLLDRIDALRDELDALIDAKTAELKADAPNVPEFVLRNLVTVRHGGCQCSAAKAILEES